MEEAALDDPIQGLKKGFPRSLLAVADVASIVRDRYLVDTISSLKELTHDLHFDAKAIGTQRQFLEYRCPKCFSARHDIRNQCVKKEICQEIENLVAQIVGKVAHTMRPQESCPDDRIG